MSTDIVHDECGSDQPTVQKHTGKKTNHDSRTLNSSSQNVSVGTTSVDVTCETDNSDTNISLKKMFVEMRTILNRLENLEKVDADLVSKLDVFAAKECIDSKF